LALTDSLDLGRLDARSGKKPILLVLENDGDLEMFTAICPQPVTQNSQDI